MAKKKKKFENRSIYIPEEDSGLDKEIDKLAKKDESIPKEFREGKQGLVSYVTIMLWKNYKRIQEKLKEQEEWEDEEDETDNFGN